MTRSGFSRRREINGPKPTSPDDSDKPAMRLYLIRHAEAVPHGAPGYPQDAQRPLTHEGRAQALAAGEALKRLQVAPDVLLTSPYVRAVQTAEQVAKGLGLRTPAKELPELRAEQPPHDA